MSGNEAGKQSAADAALEREILEGRKFTLEEAVARMVGPGAMKGESPVTRMRQAEIEIELWLGSHLPDAGGALKLILNRKIRGSELLLNGFDQPLIALAGYCQEVLNSNYRLSELVREADVEWARVMGETPYFEQEGAPHHPDDPYTVDSVRNKLSAIFEQLTGSDG